MLPVLQVGPLAIQLPGLLLLAGVWAVTSLAERSATRHGIQPDLLVNLIFYSLIAGVIGARLGYAARYLSIYAQDPIGLLSLNPSTLSLTDGELVGALVALVYGHRRKLPLWPSLDALAPGCAAFAVAIGVAHLASGDAFGAPTDWPWAIDLWGAHRHPTQVYEIVLALGVLWTVLRLERWPQFAGSVFLGWLVLASASRLFLEAFRGDSVLIFGGVRQAQLVALLLLLAAMVGLHVQAQQMLAPGPGRAENERQGVG
jgi:phosphatidylglycerol:prolipoprotein diacylglycerol transferase